MSCAVSVYFSRAVATSDRVHSQDDLEGQYAGARDLFNLKRMAFPDDDLMNRPWEGQHTVGEEGSNF
jgi:hypothetical protein